MPRKFAKTRERHTPTEKAKILATRSVPKSRSPRVERSNLEFILFAVKQARAAERFGVSRNWACRNLKTAISAYWGGRELGLHATSGKERLQRSARAQGRSRAECVVEHSVPLQVIVNRLLDGPPPSEGELKRVLTMYYQVILVTKEEDAMLRKAKLRSTMPDDWNQRDPFARYQKVGIEIAK